MNYSTNDIIEFLTDFFGEEKIRPNSDPFSEIGIVGDDFHEMMEKFQKKFSVDMQDYLWYFHTNEEGQSIGKYFFAPPYERVKRISVTPEMLAEIANKGKWDIKYPNHKLPKMRYDMIINQIFVVLILLLIIFSVLR